MRQGWAMPWLVLGLLLASSGSAGPLLVEPAPPDASNSWPLSSAGTIHWQQVYDDSFFGATPLLIEGFGFRAQVDSSKSVGADFAVRMSTTSAEPGALSTTFAANVGADDTLVFSGPTTLTTVDGDFTLITLSTPFVYDPTLGNLLIEIEQDGVTTPFTYYDSYSVSPSGLQRIAIDSGSPVGTNWGFGELVTLFEATPVPEPSTALLLGLGLAALGVRR